MKKVLICLLIICMVCFSLSSVLSESMNTQNNYAESDWVEYSLDEIGVKFYLPSDYLAFSRGMKADDPVVVASGLTPAEIDQALVNSNLYLEATNDDFYTEIMVTMIGSMISDFAAMSDSSLLYMANTWDSEFESYGGKILEKDIFTYGDIKYIRMKQVLSDAGIDYYRIQYYTTVNNQAINFVFASAFDVITEEEEAFMQSVVEKASFGNDIIMSNENSFIQNPEGFTYKLLEDGTACITGYEGLTGSLAIPSEIDGYDVTAIESIDNNLVANIYIPDSVSALQGNPFSHMWGLKTITVSENNDYYSSSDDGVLYSKDGKELICYPSAHLGEVFSAPTHVTRICSDAFHGISSLTQLILPEGLEEIEDSAFYDVNHVYSITIPSTVSKIGVNPFYAMTNLEEICVAPGNKTFTVQQGALYNRDENLLIAYPRKYVTSSFAFREGIAGIGDYAFWHNNSSIDIRFPDTLIEIGDSAFCGCANMTFSDLPKGLQSIGSSAFMSSSIAKVTIPASIRELGRACFATGSLTEAVVMPGVTEIAAVMFNDCDITSIQLPETVRMIGEMAFVNCEKLVDVNIPSSVIEIGEGAFRNCSNVLVSVVKGSFGETYCKDNDIPYQYYEQDVSSNSSMRTYLLQDGPLSVEMDESKYNILVPGMDKNDLSVVRCGMDADMLDTYLSMSNYSMLIININDHVPADLKYAIRIKDNKYEGVDLREATSFEVNYILDYIYQGFESSGSDKGIVTINGVPYLKFKWMDGYQLRYATIINGDMIYIWVENETGLVTDDEAANLLAIVESIKY